MNLPPLLRFLAWHAIQGAVVGLIAGIGLVLTNIGGLGDLFAGSQQPLTAGFLFFSFFALTFASLKMATAIMLLPDEE